MAVLSRIETEPDPELITMFPVVSPPSVSVLFRRDWMVLLAASSTRPLPLVEAETVATGVPAAIPLTANKAEEVEMEPRRRSFVEFDGDSAPEFNCQ